MPAYLASKSRPIIYLNVPKAGCTSIKNWMFFLDHGYYLKDPLDIHNIDVSTFPHYDGDRPALMSRFLDSFVFTFVRHPLVRAYSTFREKILRIGPQSFKHARDFIENHYGITLDGEAGLEQTRAGFLIFLQFVEDTRDGRVPFRFDWHWAPQTVIVRNALGVRTLDFIGRLEAAEDRAFVASKAGQPLVEIPKNNEGPKIGPTYNEILTDDIKTKGRAVYKDDLLNFAYTI